MKKYLTGRDLNQGPFAQQSNALPTELQKPCCRGGGTFVSSNLGCFQTRYLRLRLPREDHFGLEGGRDVDQVLDERVDVVGRPTEKRKNSPVNNGF